MLSTKIEVMGARGPATDDEIVDVLRKHARGVRGEAAFADDQVVHLVDRDGLPADLALRDIGVVVHDDGGLTTMVAVLHSGGTPLVVPIMTARLAATEPEVAQPASAEEEVSDE
jgi:phosphohistidine swiveling domain-containing protein